MDMWWKLFSITGSPDAYLNFKENQREDINATFENKRDSNKELQSGRKRTDADRFI